MSRLRSGPFYRPPPAHRTTWLRPPHGRRLRAAVPAPGAARDEGRSTVRRYRRHGAARKNVLRLCGDVFLPEPIMTAPSHDFPFALSLDDEPVEAVTVVAVDDLRQRIHDRLTQ